MEQKTNTRTILVNRIEWKSKSEIFLTGYALKEGKLQRTRFVHNRKTLYVLLQQNGERGEEIINRLSETLKHPHAVPLVVDLTEIFGTIQPFSYRLRELGHVSTNV